MDILWAITIAANTLLLCLLIWQRRYRDFSFLTFLVGFNVVTVPILWYVYDRLPDLYPRLYYSKMYAVFILWLAVCVEAHYMKRPQVAIPIEVYAFIKATIAVLFHFELFKVAYGINNLMRGFNIAAILWLMYIFYPRKETTMSTEPQNPIEPEFPIDPEELPAPAFDGGETPPKHG